MGYGKLESAAVVVLVLLGELTRCDQLPYSYGETERRGKERQGRQWHNGENCACDRGRASSFTNGCGLPDNMLGNSQINFSLGSSEAKKWVAIL
jgi:hypothetical protein